MSGRLEAIWIKTAHRAPMTAVNSARAVAGRGLDGNINQAGQRQVTLLSAEAWADVCHELGVGLDPAVRRANLLVRGIDLENSRGQLVDVGGVTILIHGETKPCQLMDQTSAGLRQRLAAGWRGGAYGEVMADGEISVGDPVEWVEGRSPEAS